MVVNSSSAALRYAVHDSLVTAAFSGLFLLKMANLFPGELDLNVIAVHAVTPLARVELQVGAKVPDQPLTRVHDLNKPSRKARDTYLAGE